MIVRGYNNKHKIDRTKCTTVYNIVRSIMLYDLYNYFNRQFSYSSILTTSIRSLLPVKMNACPSSGALY